MNTPTFDAAPPTLSLQPSPGFSSWLDEMQFSLAMSTYQIGKLFLLGLNVEGKTRSSSTISKTTTK
jgi:hypothetical protein